MHLGTFKLADDGPEYAINTLAQVKFNMAIPSDAFNVPRECACYTI